jgi:TonB family protein
VASRLGGERAPGAAASNQDTAAAPIVAAAPAAATASQGGAVAAPPESHPGDSTGGERDAAAAEQDSMLPFERAAAAREASPAGVGGASSSAAAGGAQAGGAPASITAESAADAEDAPRPMSRGDLIRPRGPGVVPPRLLSRPEPDYPDRARRRRAEAHVLLLVLVDENGRVLRAIVKQTDDPDLGFNQAARRAALQALFAPATRDGIAGKMWTELPFDFLVKS